MCVMLFDSGMRLRAPSLSLYLGDESILCGCYGKLLVLNKSSEQYAFDLSGMWEIFQPQFGAPVGRLRKSNRVHQTALHP